MLLPAITLHLPTFRQRQHQLLPQIPYHIPLSCESLNPMNHCTSPIQTKMDQQLARANTRAPVTISMTNSLHRYIILKLAKYGWLTTYEDHQDLSCEILRNLLDLCHAGNSQRFILEMLSDHKTHLEMAEWISTVFMSHNPAPRDRGLLSFTEGVVGFFHDLCWDHFDRVHTADDESQIEAEGITPSYTQASRQTVSPT